MMGEAAGFSCTSWSSLPLRIEEGKRKTLNSSNLQSTQLHPRNVPNSSEDYPTELAWFGPEKKNQPSYYPSNHPKYPSPTKTETHPTHQSPNLQTNLEEEEKEGRVCIQETYNTYHLGKGGRKGEGRKAKWMNQSLARPQSMN